MLGAALASDVPLIALHLTRPAVTIPDRKKLGVADYMDAAKGAYVIKPHDPSRPKEGTILVLGTSTTDSIYELLPRFLDGEGPNVKLVQCTSPELFAMQTQAYRDSVLPREDWLDSTVVSNGSRRSMHDWMPHRQAEEWAMTSDFDDRWRTGGSVDELKREAKIDPESLWEGIAKFAAAREERLAALRVE